MSLGLITPQINRLDLNGCAGCTREIGDARSDAVAVLTAIRRRLSTTGTYLLVGDRATSSISNEERLAINDALYELNSPSSFATTSVVAGRTVVGNPTPTSQLFDEIDGALRSTVVAQPAGGGRPKWLIPVAIGAGVLVVGGITVMLLRK